MDRRSSYLGQGCQLPRNQGTTSSQGAKHWPTMCLRVLMAGTTEDIDETM
jgi:hypothetical protein